MTRVKNIPPDGGWGWVIVFATCVIMFTYTSLSYCFGMVYVYLVQEGYSNTEVAIIPAIMNGVANLLAPFSTGLTRYYSHRRIVAIGFLCLSCGLLLCSLYNNIIWFYLCYGFIIGIGYALVKPQGVLLGQQYFEKRRVTANGLSMVGMSIGLMTLPVVVNYLAQEYSYQGAFMLWSGIVLHGLIGASLYHPVKWHMKYQEASFTEDPESLETPSAVSNFPSTKDDGLCEKDSFIIEERDPGNEIEESSDSEDSSSEAGKKRGSLLDPLNTNGISSHPHMKKNSARNSIDENYHGLIKHQKVSMLSRENRQRTISLHSSAGTLPGACDLADEFGSCLSFVAENDRRKNPPTELNEGEGEEERVNYYLCCGVKILKLRDIIKVSLFKHPAFLISSFSGIANRMVYLCFVTYLPSIAKEMDIGKNTPYLLTCLAIAELLAKLIISAISDCGWIQRRYFYIMSSFLSSGAILSVTFTSGFWGLSACCFCYGLCMGTTMSVGPVLLVEYIGVDLLPYSFGLMLFMNGIAGIFMFFMTGLLNDTAGSYHVTYWVIGILTLMPGTLWSMINLVNNKKNTNEDVTTE